jgi:Skp family chaperone for outer membrane proteins
MSNPKLEKGTFMMPRSSLRLPALAGLLLALIALPSIASAQAMSAGPTRIGVVNVGKVFNSMQETKDLQARFESERQGLQQLGAQHQQELTNLQQMLRNGPKPGSQQYEDQQEQLDEKRVQYDNDVKLKQLQSVRNQARQLRVIFDKIEVAVGDVARQRGLDLVITELKPDLTENQDLTPEEISQRINQRNLMFVDPKIDITAEVVTTLDAKYKAGEK